ncbi:hypothetical protein TNCT_196231 [Trichonephila clavata]|uniref:Uncharacterized protein n=1 Tax=Trichonephila clavata TaxID=2740835 RepID=A0A8X6HE57_TRICU|nr:hypothetical protein TNCT_196231 [Trichonephila clavata]
MSTYLSSTDIPHSPIDVLEHFVMLFTTNTAAFMTSLAVDVAAAKIFLSQSLYALFAIRHNIFSLARHFFADKYHLPITHIPQISCKLIEVWFLSFLVAEKLTIKVDLEHFKVTLEVSPNK